MIKIDKSSELKLPNYEVKFKVYGSFMLRIVIRYTIVG